MVSPIVKMLSNRNNKRKVKFMTGCFIASVSSWTCHFFENTKHRDQDLIRKTHLKKLKVIAVQVNYFITRGKKAKASQTFSPQKSITDSTE